MNYKRLGDYIIEKVEFNEGNKYDLLQGVSNNKYFQKAKTNTIGVDLSKYRVAHHNQFVFNRATTRNGDKISIALRKGESCIVSPSYRIFEVNDENVLNPDYLSMWFKRPEFDRYARFKSHGSAHEFFDMDEMNDVELPIPSIEKQRELVAQYQAVENKIKVNEQICEKLEATAQTLYKQWFVDFEFPNEEGQPYKSSGGSMVFNEELEKEIPEGWEVKSLGEVSTCLDFKRRPLSQEERAQKPGKYPYYGAMSIVGYIDEYIYDGDYLLFSEDGANVVDENGFPAIQYVWGKFWLNNHSHILVGKDYISIQFLYNSLLKTNVSDLVTGAAQPKINQQNMNSISILIGNESIHQKFNLSIIENYELTKIYQEQNQKLTQFQSLLLSRLATLEG